MGRINQDYATDSTVTGDDKVIGTDAADNSTKNYTIDGIKGYILTGGATGSFTAASGETVTVVDGIITSII